MTNVKKIESLAKKLLKRSLTEDKLDNKKVESIIKELKQLNPDFLVDLLKTYTKLIEVRLEQETAVVETPFVPDNAWAMATETDLKAKFPQINFVRFEVNPHLIAGIKVQIADMIYENSFKGKLENLRSLN